jgi:hypothetical protein
MKKKLIEHLLSIAFVSLVFIIVIAGFKAGQKEVQNRQDAAILPVLNLGFIDLDNPLHRALLRETMNIYYPESAAKNDSLLRAIDKYRAAQAANLTKKLNPYEGLTFRKFWQLAGMYFIFILAYLVVMALTYYGVLTLAILRFLKMKQNLTSYLAELWFYLQKTPFPLGPRSIGKYLLFVVSLLGKALIKGIMYIILFSPAYVIAYSFRTGFNTDTFFFMVLLGVISNGLLITYAQKFYTFLAAESRKGYVQTAIVKGLNNNYSQKAPDGILSTIKEQASFLITGLVIIEMALNIHGHLCYEMLQNILYRQFDVVLTIILGIFWVLKATEIAADYWLLVETRKYDNR